MRLIKEQVQRGSGCVRPGSVHTLVAAVPQHQMIRLDKKHAMAR